MMLHSLSHFTLQTPQQKGEEKMEDNILEAMKKAAKPLRPGDIAKMVGADSKEVSAVIAKLKKEGKVISPRRCYYAPAGE